MIEVILTVEDLILRLMAIGRDAECKCPGIIEPGVVSVDLEFDVVDHLGGYRPLRLNHKKNFPTSFKFKPALS